ncbi:hypothetical protein SAMN04487947_0980 [Halogeometricum rufum]|uniref:Uncharacterized protein n=1 Tax=Halogeometricum rufum TaxID=553469 RepID=A0A1I6GDT2_9EURY|nr:hypothetical protein [Halogeometricum rufum]SFR40346.1 hypothetical protein SAMN04487947_0980 [Halogeometricum rufum]
MVPFVLQFGVPGGVEILILFLVYGLFGLIPVVAALVVVYYIYKIRQDTNRMAESLERIAERL